MRYVPRKTKAQADRSSPKTPVAAELRDFCMSEDVLDWVTSGTNWSMIGFTARVYLPPTGGGVGYGGGLALNGSGIPGNVTPWLSYAGYQTNGVPFQISEFPPPYRLEYSAVGTRFTLRVFSLNTRQLIREMSWTDSSRGQGLMGLFVGAPSGAHESHSVTVDNFFLSGTKP